MLVWLLVLVTVLLVAPALFVLAHLARHLNRQKHQGFGRRSVVDPNAVDAPAPLTRKKPDWIVHEVLRLKALMGKHAGCRKVADTFNRLHAPTRVGKSFVSNTILNHQYALLNISRELRDKRPAPVNVNSVWGVDLTFVRDHVGTPRPVLGVVDHGSRVCAQLAAVVNKRSWTLVGHLCLAIGQHGKPRAIRTDNDLVFKSAVFKMFLKIVGIRHQRIPVCAPWCNGRIESFFGRIKPFINQLDIHSPVGLQNALDEIRHFFNHVRTHQNLAGLTPAEAWAGLTPTDLAQTPTKSTQLVQALDGLLVGYHIRR
jgi:transposase InsO family protein